ncbi:hypothetical protein SM11_pC0299 (plasmid) [Sinorhizobium meliloti SM11]|uniref:Uncharacterized protein n=1 Tax=Sinorhizobium meliloti (strain SM11) TaxID=707241 RepID=F7XC81_SINMM|nr:hypothetical protein SM11_pC0299 [Sinorhizobium meliloti SM11]
MADRPFSQPGGEIGLRLSSRGDHKTIEAPSGNRRHACAQMIEGVPEEMHVSTS